MKHHALLTCPRCGSALGGTTAICPSCLTPLAPAWDRFERWTRATLVLLCVAAAVVLAGGVVLEWLRHR